MSNVHQLPRFSRDLEENVVGAILAAAALDVQAGHRTLDKIVAAGLEPADFYIRSLGRIYHRLIEQRQLGYPLDALSLYHRLEQEHDADPHDLGTLERLAHTCPAVTPAPHWARLIASDARARNAAA